MALVGKALNDARTDLQHTLDELRREKAWTDHLLANVSHEFRTPLSAVATAVELMMDQAPDLSPDELQELLTSLHLGVLSLEKLVDNLLESASIEAGRFQVHPRPCNLDDIIVEAVRTMQPLLNKYGQRLTVELPASIPVVQADPAAPFRFWSTCSQMRANTGPPMPRLLLASYQSAIGYESLLATKDPVSRRRSGLTCFNASRPLRRRIPTGKPALGWVCRW